MAGQAGCREVDFLLTGGCLTHLTTCLLCPLSLSLQCIEVKHCEKAQVLVISVFLSIGARCLVRSGLFEECRRRRFPTLCSGAVLHLSFYVSSAVIGGEICARRRRIPIVLYKLLPAQKRYWLLWLASINLAPQSRRQAQHGFQLLRY
jgi:hypothetical protein